MQRARCYLLGERAAVLEIEPPLSIENQKKIGRLARRLLNVPEVIEAIPGMNNITVTLTNPQEMAFNAVECLERWWTECDSLDLPDRRVDIPVIYGKEAGPDLDEVAHLTGLTPRQVVLQHSAVDYTVCFLGLRPGFPWLDGLPRALHVPALAEPRAGVPAGAIGIGGSQTGIYPRNNFGVGRIIGRTELSLFDPQRQPPALLAPGDIVRFVPQREGIC